MMRHNVKWRCSTHQISCESEEDFHTHLQEAHQQSQQIPKTDLYLISDYSKQPSLDCILDYRESSHETYHSRATR
jgi:hypothetical protein